MKPRWARILTVAMISVVLAAAIYAAVAGLTNVFQAAPMARLHFTTTDALLFAELLPLDGDEPLRPAFTIKDSGPLQVPAGSYRLRVGALGWLSETLRVDALAGQEATIPVLLADSSMWRPHPLPHGGELFEFDGRADVIEYTPTGVRRLQGADLKPLWEVQLDADEPEKRAVLLEQAKMRWGEFLPKDGDPYKDYEKPRLARTAEDLDGDGEKDLLWLSRKTPALFAQSGHNGSLLWAYRASDEGHVFGDPVAFQLDGKDVPAFLVTFRGIKTCWLDALRGDTGERLWRFALDPACFDGTYQCQLSPNTIAKVDRDVTQFPVAVMQRDGKAIISLVAGATLLELDARTGQQLGEPLPLDQPREGGANANSGVTFAGQPRLGIVLRSQFVDLGNGVIDLLVLRWSAARGLDLTALSLKTRKTLWERTLKDSRAWWFGTLDWPSVYRDADGTTTILAHDGSTANHCVLTALDGKTGEVRWTKQLLIDPKASGGSYRLDRFLAGPDLDGDGRREIFVATLGMPHRHEGWPHHYLFVDALSGKNGQTLWTTRLRQPGPTLQEADYPRQVLPLAWWQTGGDGWPQLVVPVRRAASDEVTESMTYILSAGSGRVLNVLPGIENARVADLDGDGIPDLHWFAWYKNAHNKDVRELDTARGTLPETWRRFGAWRPAKNYDGDGITDYVRVEPGKAKAAVVSGRDGRLLQEIDAEAAPPDSPITGLIVKRDGWYHGFITNGGGLEWRTREHPTLVPSIKGDQPARLVYQTDTGTACHLITLTPDRESPRIDQGAITRLEQFAEIVARYHLDGPAVAILGAALLAAFAKRRWLLAVLMLLAPAAAYGALRWHVQVTPPSDRDPRVAAMEVMAGLGSQAVVLAVAAFLVGMLSWRLWRLARPAIGGRRETCPPFSPR